MARHESKLNSPPTLVISSARIDKTDRISKSEPYIQTTTEGKGHQTEGSYNYTAPDLAQGCQTATRVEVH